MTEQLFIDESPFGIRVLRTESGVPVRLMHKFACRSSPSVGSIFWAKAGTRDDRLGGQVFDLGAAGEGLLPIRNKTYPRGSMVLVSIRRESVGLKRPLLTDRPALKLPCAAILPNGDVSPGPLGMKEPTSSIVEFAQSPPSAPQLIQPVLAVVELVALCATSNLQTITCATGTLAASIRPFVPDSVFIETDSEVAEAIDAAEDQGLQPVVPLQGGGKLIIEQTEALTALDLDTGSRHGHSARGAAAGLFREALRVLNAALSLRRVGGQVVLDLPRGAVRSPKMIRDQLSSILKPAGLSSIPAVTKEGLVVMIFGQNQQTLRDALTEDALTDDMVWPGRRLRGDILAWRAYVAAANALRAQPGGSVRLGLPPSAYALWSKQEAERSLVDAFGPRFVVNHTQNETFTVEKS